MLQKGPPLVSICKLVFALFTSSAPLLSLSLLSEYTHVRSECTHSHMPRPAMSRNKHQYVRLKCFCLHYAIRLLVNFEAAMGKSCYEKWTVNEPSVFYFFILRSFSRNTEKTVAGVARKQSSTKKLVCQKMFGSN